jgi:hypothetical protein
MVLLEGLLELGEVLSQLRKLCGFVFLRRRVDLTIVPRRPEVLPCYRGSGAGDGVLCFVYGFHLPVDIEAFPRRVVVVGFRARIRLYGVETSPSFFRQPLPD